MVLVCTAVRSWGRHAGKSSEVGGSLGCGNREEEAPSGLFGRKAMYLGGHLDVSRPVLQRVTWLGKYTTLNLNSDNRVENMEVVSFSRGPPNTNSNHAVY